MSLSSTIFPHDPRPHFLCICLPRFPPAEPALTLSSWVCSVEAGGPRRTAQPLPTPLPGGGWGESEARLTTAGSHSLTRSMGSVLTDHGFQGAALQSPGGVANLFPQRQDLPSSCVWVLTSGPLI